MLSSLPGVCLLHHGSYRQGTGKEPSSTAMQGPSRHVRPKSTEASYCYLNMVFLVPFTCSVLSPLLQAGQRWRTGGRNCSHWTEGRTETLDQEREKDNAPFLVKPTGSLWLLKSLSFKSRVEVLIVMLDILISELRLCLPT